MMEQLADEKGIRPKRKGTKTPKDVKKRKLQKIIELLSDGEWHPAIDISAIICEDQIQEKLAKSTLSTYKKDLEKEGVFVENDKNHQGSKQTYWRLSPETDQDACQFKTLGEQDIEECTMLMVLEELRKIYGLLPSDEAGSEIEQQDILYKKLFQFIYGERGDFYIDDEDICAAAEEYIEKQKKDWKRRKLLKRLAENGWLGKKQEIREYGRTVYYWPLQLNRNRPYYILQKTPEELQKFKDQLHLDGMNSIRADRMREIDKKVTCILKAYEEGLDEQQITDAPKRAATGKQNEKMEKKGRKHVTDRVRGKAENVPNDEREKLLWFMSLPYRNKKLALAYKGRKGEIQHYIWETALIFYNHEKNSYYVLGGAVPEKMSDSGKKPEPMLLRLGQIVEEETKVWTQAKAATEDKTEDETEDKTKGKKKGKTEDQTINSIHDPENYKDPYKQYKQIYNEMFSASLGRRNEKPMDVKIRFRIISENMRRRLKHLVEVRKASGARLEEDEAEKGVMIYTDKVRGLEDLAAYLRLYGRACVVEEPACLRERMKLTAKKVMDAYRREGLIDE